MSLATYHRKRNFRKTAEPKGRVKKSRSDLAFVIQKHDASHLHYDFRLELDGVLKSWAVPKGPSLDPAIRSLAIEVEDHPLDYGSFEGTIPRGQYGGGTVMLWDRGQWIPDGDPHEGFDAGKLAFTLEGEKLKGRWKLVRIRAGDDRRRHWLLIKSHDENARPGSGYGVLNDKSESVKTGRDLGAIAEGNGHDSTEPRKARSAKTKKRTGRGRSTGDLAREARALSHTRVSKQPTWIAPQLAVLAENPPESENWVHEIKFDGYRLISVRQGEDVRLLTRNQKDWTAKFPTVAAAVARLPVSQAIFDGEVVILDKKGISHFQSLQQVMQNGNRGDVVYVVFDLLHCEGVDVRSAPLLERKRLLSSIIGSAGGEGVLQYSPHLVGGGAEALEAACKLGLEGLIFKRADSVYESKRSRNWVKVKCSQRQEFVIGGFTDPRRSRTGFGALLLGYYGKDGGLVYCGRVGTGFDEKLLKDMRRRLDEIEQSRPAYRNPPVGADSVGVHWVKPQLVAEVAYRAITSDGLLRQPTFQGLRVDKSAKEVVREVPKEKSEDVAPKPKGRLPVEKSVDRKKKQVHGHASGNGEMILEGVKITHPERVIFPGTDVTKERLAQYYSVISEYMLPHVVDRPLMLVRCPEGAAGGCFHQKHLTGTFPKSIQGVKIREKSQSGEYPIVKDLGGLIALVQMNTLEIHGWGSGSENIEHPDRVILDLDPGASVPWKSVCDAATLIRDLLLRKKLKSFVKTSGGKGLHVVVPIKPDTGWDRVKAFAQEISVQLADAAPDQFVSKMTKSIRQGKIFVDYLRNGRGATCVLPYSTRARAGAPISMPVPWNSLHRVSSADAFTVETAMATRKLVDPWKEFFSTRQSLK
jgi:bifunctional non-homologous end joining protein LigD